MEWIATIKEAIQYMESNILTVQSPREVAENVYLSEVYLQRGFQVITGYSIGEYIRNRRMYLAALDLINTQEKIIDLAYKYSYETPESFTKAFTRFHQCTPTEARNCRSEIKTFLPLKIQIVVQGGTNMEFKVEKMESFKVIGFAEEFDVENSKSSVPEFWDRVFSKHVYHMMNGEKPRNAIEKAICDNHIGEFGICIECTGGGASFKYMIAGKYLGGEVPEGLEVVDIPAAKWAKFKCIGAIPDAIQKVNDRIWKEWLPGNKEYELDGSTCIEWYSPEGINTDPDYESGSWIPVKEIV